MLVFPAPMDGLPFAGTGVELYHHECMSSANLEPSGSEAAGRKAGMHKWAFDDL
jgi:hypothetical protein